MGDLPRGYDIWRMREPDMQTGLGTWHLEVTVRVSAQSTEEDLALACDRIEDEVRAALARHGVSGTVLSVRCDDADFVDWVEADYGRDWDA